MDCVDMVLMAARGDYSRVFDAFSRDRSTPKIDTYYADGKNSLTAAIAKEVNGETTVLFRRKLAADDENLDHTFSNEDMTVVWAFGQEHLNYNHAPITGLELCNVMDIFFYRKDVPMYHGHQGQRGATTLNFLNSGNGDSKNSITVGGNSLKWTVKDSTVEFIMRVNVAVGEWAAFGISNNRQMSQTDVMHAGISSTGAPVFSDRWAAGYSRPSMDEDNSGENAVSSAYNNGVLTLTIIRPRTASSNEDFSFRNADCHHIIHATGAGFTGQSFGKHTINPTISEEKYCFESSGAMKMSAAGFIVLLACSFISLLH